MSMAEFNETAFDLFAAMALLLIIIGMVAVVLIGGIITGAVERIRKGAREDMEAHEAWLFKQLYSMAPGKVLEPDAREEVAQARPATVYSPEKDPMSEFTGGKDDWHG